MFQGRKPKQTMVEARAIAMILAIAIPLGTPARSLAQSSDVTVELNRIGDALHLEFSGAKDWRYELKKDDAGKVVLKLKDVKPETLAKLRGQTDSLVKSVTVSPDQAGGAEVVFAIGESTDFFDYITDQPSRLIVDFFPKEGADLKPKATAKAEAAKAEAKKQEKKLPTKIVKKPDQNAQAEDDEAGERDPAGTDLLLVAKGELPPLKPVEPPTLAEEISSKKDFSHGIFDGGDPEFRRFTIRDHEINEDAIIRSRANFYLNFPMLTLGTPQLKSLLSTQPAYEIVPVDTRENKEARILETLFKEKKRALFLKTAEEFTKKYPKSEYDEIVRYMVADTYFGVWREEGSVEEFDVAMDSYLKLAEKYPESPITPRTLLLIGYSYLDRGDSFGALKAFQRFVRLSPSSRHMDRVNISIAEAYLKLNRYDEALSLLGEVEKGAKTQKMKFEAAFRKGDVHFRQRDYAKAIETYKAIAKKYPEASTQFPNAWYNVAEAEFLRGRYREALEAYRVFLQKFPDHEHGGYAMTRMGELLGILGADPKRAQGAFMESYFRYRTTPGAGVARIRFLAARMPDMKEKELASALREMDTITRRYSVLPKDDKKKEENKDEHVAEGHGEAKDEKKKKDGEKAGGAPGMVEQMTGGVLADDDDPRAQMEDKTQKPPSLDNIEELTKLLIADGRTARKEFQTATELLIKYYQQNPQSPNKDRIRGRIVRNITEEIRDAVDHGDFMEALRTYSRYTDSWLKHTERVDVPYYVGRAYEQAGVYQEAEKVYQSNMKRLSRLKSRKEEQEDSLFEFLPKTDATLLRLAAVAAKERDFARAEINLKKIKSEADLTEAEQIERAELSADVAEARGQSELARKYLAELMKAWKGDPVLTSPLHLRVAKLWSEAKKYKEVDQHLNAILDMRKSTGKVSDEIVAKALELQGDSQVARGQRAQAVETFRNLLEQFEDKQKLASVRYRAGQILFEDGDLKGAEELWTGLKPGKDDIWQKLALEQMQGAKWQKEYKKYLNRIPAAAELQKPSATKAR